MPPLILCLSHPAASDPLLAMLRVVDLLRLARVSKEARRGVLYNQHVWTAALRALALPSGDVVVRRVVHHGEMQEVPRIRSLLDDAPRRCHECLRVPSSYSDDDMFHIWFAVRKEGANVLEHVRPRSLGMLCRGCTRQEGGFRRVVGRKAVFKRNVRRLTLVYAPRPRENKERRRRKDRILCGWHAD